MRPNVTDLNQTFAALSDTTRRAIVARLAEGEAPLAEVAAPFQMSLTAVSKHVRVLRDAGLISVTKRGRTRYCRIEATPMREAVDWLNDYQRFWDQQLDALGAFLQDENEDD
jgi:DNA-binding transcriptional ArsR family regulator